MFGNSAGFPAELKISSLGAYIHALLSRVTLALARLYDNVFFCTTTRPTVIITITTLILLLLVLSSIFFNLLISPTHQPYPLAALFIVH